MTSPRQVLAGSTWLVSRRCSERRNFLRPSEAANAILEFVLGVAASRHGVELHAYCFMSNHFHLVLTDPGARLPEFVQYFDGLVARAMNLLLGRSESFWDPSSFSAVRLETPESIVEKCAYTLGNPVAAGLVRHARQWPGVCSETDRMGGEALEVVRPAAFFRSNGPLPATTRLVLTCPPGFATLKEFTEAVAEALGELERKKAEDLLREGRDFLGPARVLSQEAWTEPRNGPPSRGMKPNVASRDKWTRIEALARLKHFRLAYREALSSWRRGLRSVLFPEGTWLMRVRHSAPCAGAG